MTKAILVIIACLAVAALGWLVYSAGFRDGLVAGLKTGFNDEHAETTMQIIWLRKLSDGSDLLDTKRKVSEHIANKLRDLELKKETIHKLSASQYLKDRMTGRNYYEELSEITLPDLKELEKRYDSAMDATVIQQNN